MDKCSFFYYSNMNEGNEAMTTSLIVLYHRWQIDHHVARERGVCNSWDIQLRMRRMWTEQQYQR